jgi:cell division protein FtsB
MNDKQLAEIKRIKGILSAVTGLEDDDQEYIEDARKALQSIISQDALDKKADNARELGLSYDDVPAVQEGRDWSLLEATQESLREHMAEIKRLQKEIIEQCRIIAMSAEREDALRSEIKRLKAEQPAPVQEPLGYIATMAANDLRASIYGDVTVYGEDLEDTVAIYTTPPAAQPGVKEG